MKGIARLPRTRTPLVAIRTLAQQAAQAQPAQPQSVPHDRIRQNADDRMTSDGIANDAVAAAPHSELPPQDATFSAAAVRPHQSASTSRILTSLAVFQLCAVPALVAAAPTAIAVANRTGLSAPLNAVLKKTFFAHFCGGENLNEVLPTMQSFQQAGIGSILDLAMEADIDGASLAGESARTHAASIAGMFKQSIDIAMHQKDSFIAVKLTALVPPALLQRWSNTLLFIRSAFPQPTITTTTTSLNLPVYTVDQFVSALTKAFPSLDPSKATALFATIDADKDGRVDWIDISTAFSLHSPQNIAVLVDAISSANSSNSIQHVTADDMQTASLVLAEIDALCAYARDKRVRIMIDAEQTYFQPAIDDMTLGLCRKWNPSTTSTENDGPNGPVLFNTYQMYLRDAYGRLVMDVERARRHHFSFGAKLVRGAYMVSERDRANKLGLADPIQPTLDATHSSFNTGVAFLIEAISRHPLRNDGTVAPISLVVASHNKESVRHATLLMRRHNIQPHDGTIAFAQLMGMQDATTYSLASNGYRAYKYIPYGPVSVTIPYLHRRAQENSSVLGAVGDDKRHLLTELKIRMGLLKS